MLSLEKKNTCIRTFAAPEEFLLTRPALQTEGLKKVVVALLEMSDPTVFQHGPYCGLKAKISQAEPL